MTENDSAPRGWEMGPTLPATWVYERKARKHPDIGFHFKRMEQVVMRALIIVGGDP